MTTTIRLGVFSPSVLLDVARSSGALADAGLVKGKTVGIDATTLEANAALRTIVRRDTNESYHELLTKLAQASGMETRARAIIDKATDPAKAKIVIAYFSFSNTAVYNKLCEKGKAGFDIEGFFDQSYRTQMPAQLATSCQGPSGHNVRVHFLGQLSQSPWIWRLHHNKFLLVDTGVDNEPVNLNFLFHFAARTHDNDQRRRANDMALRTLKALAAGGIHDQLGGGFHR